MKICVFGLRGFPLVEGGVEKHCEALYSHIQYDADITVFRRKPYVRTKAKYKNITFIDLASTKIKGLEVILHSFLATRRAAKMNPDVVHIHNIGPALFAKKLYKKGIPVPINRRSSESRRRPRALCYRTGSRRACARCRRRWTRPSVKSC